MYSAALQQIFNSVSSPVIFNDIRDDVLKQWNQLLALIGCGKGYYSTQMPPIDFTPDGLCSLMKTICYNHLVSEKNEDGILLLICNQTYNKLHELKFEFADNLNKILGNRPNITVNVLNIHSLNDQKCCVSIKVIERNLNKTNIIPCNELMTYFAPHIQQSNQIGASNIRNLLNSLGIEDIKPKIGPTAEELQIYLANPPSNIDPVIWNQAIQENPEPTKLIPVPVLGFSGLNERLTAMKTENEAHKKQMEDFKTNLTQQQLHLVEIETKITSMTRKYRELRHRLIKVKCFQDTKRLSSLPIQMFEVDLRDKLEDIQRQINSDDPKSLGTQVNLEKRLLETRLKTGFKAIDDTSENKVPEIQPDFLDEFKKFLTNQQECLDQMVSVIKQDTKDLSLIQQTMHDTFT